MRIKESLRMPASFIDRAQPYSPDPTHQRRRYVLRGALIGLAVAVIARLFMRSITGEEPKFSIGGTGFIFVVIAGLGACAGLAFAWRRLRSQRRLRTQRAVGLAPFLLMGPFMVLFLPGLAAALLLAHRGWRRWLRWPLTTAAVLFAAFILLVMGARGGLEGPASVVLYPIVAYAMFLTNRIVFEPRQFAATPPAPVANDPYEPWMGWAWGT